MCLILDSNIIRCRIVPGAAPNRLIVRYPVSLEFWSLRGRGREECVLCIRNDGHCGTTEGNHEILVSTRIASAEIRTRYLRCTVQLIINSVEQSSSWEAGSHSASKKFPAFYETQSLPCSQELATGLYPEPDASSSHRSSVFP
jgi:hypothetical protein